jgi:hypothetical protein
MAIGVEVVTTDDHSSTRPSFTLNCTHEGRSGEALGPARVGPARQNASAGRGRSGRSIGNLDGGLMDGHELWRVVQGVSLAATLIAASSGVVGLAPGATTPVAEAGVAAGKRDDKDDKRNKDRRRDDDRGDDFVLNGQVLEIHTELTR